MPESSSKSENCLLRIVGILVVLAFFVESGCAPREDLWVIARRNGSILGSSTNAARLHQARRTLRKSKAVRRDIPAFQTVDGPETNSRFGHTVAGAGDVNGDGFDDVLVGAFFGGSAIPGEVSLFYGSPSGIKSKADWRFVCPVPDADFGHQVDGVGDINGDGFADFLVGATYYSGKTLRGGGAFLFLGGSNGPGSKPDWEMSGEQPGSGAGFTVAAAGDVNGDGFADILVGAYNQTNSASARTIPSQGKVFLYTGGTNGLSKGPVWAPVGEGKSSRFGYSVHGAGDLNGDGYADIVIGGWGFEAERFNAGRVYVYYGARGGPSSFPDWTMTGTQTDQYLGNSVFTAGDVNGDGFDDLIVASNLAAWPERYEGVVFVFYGSATGLPEKPSWAFESNQHDFFLGHSVATAGDINGDGFDDVILGAFNGKQFLPDEGVAFVFHGSATGLTHHPQWTF